ncbi:vps-33.2 [Pristionchus pacificus]|nr:vps-33.2 [Pristionchus pacificus]
MKTMEEGLKDGSLPSSDVEGGGRATRVFLMRCSLANARLLAAFLRSDEATPAAVIWVDRVLPMAERELERAGVYGAVDQSALALPMLPIEADLFSLELPQSRQTEYYSVAQSLYQLQSLYGQFPTIYGVGEAAERVSKMMKVLYADRGEPRALADQPISHLFLLDRNLDPASVLMSGLTYESMLHDAFRIRCGKVQFGQDVEERLRASMREEGGGGGGKSSKFSIVALDNNDGVFASVRNMHMTAVFPWLSAKAREIQASYDKGAQLDALADVKAFVSSELKTLKTRHRQLETHICACEVLLERSGSGSASERLGLEHALVAGQADMNQVLEFLEDSMLAEQSPWQVLALACLASLASCGLPQKIFSSFRESFLHAYGFDTLPILHSLCTRRLLFVKPSPLSKLREDGAGGRGGGDAREVRKKELLSSLPAAAAAAAAAAGSSPTHSASSGPPIPTLPFIVKRLGLVPSAQQLVDQLVVYPTTSRRLPQPRDTTLAFRIPRTAQELLHRRI